MAVKLVVAEKASQAKAVAAALGGSVGSPFTYNGTEYVIVPLSGHIFEIAEPGAQDPKWASKKTNGRFIPVDSNALPILPTKLKYVPTQADKVARLQAVVAEHGITEDNVINCGDADREGSGLVAVAVAQALGFKASKMSRAWIESEDAAGYQKAFDNIRPPEFDAGRVGAQLCRARADWSLGMSASRAVIGNVGRVQTPVLGIIVDAFRKHMGAATSAFFKVTATGCGTDFEYRDALGSDNNKIAAKPAANKIAEEIKAGTATVVSADVRSSAKSAPTLFDLALLQVAASAAHKMSAKAVLATVQSLYEAGIVSYPRTDFKLLSADAADDLVALLKANLPKGVNAADLDVSKVTTTEAMAHQALHVKKVATNLTGDQAKVYRLIFDRCVAAMLPAHVSDRQTIWVQSGGHYLRADLAKTTSAGFAAVDKKALNKDTLLTLNAGDTVALSDVAAVEAKTKKPPVMTEARLLKLMANPKALLANEEADLDRLDALTRASGLGTPATRDSYCPGLETRGLIKIQAGGKLIPTDKGIKLVSRLESTQETSVFLSPTITADWEGRLNEMEAATTVADATAQFKAFTAEFDRFLTDSMGPLKALRGIYGSASVTPCPKCDDGLLDAVSYDKGKKNFISCSNNEKGNENSKCDLFVWLAATKATAKKLAEVATGSKAAR